MKIRVIHIHRDCAANLDNTPIHGLKAGTILQGVVREEGHPDNSRYALGCIEIDTKAGTYTIPADAVTLLTPIFGRFNFLRGLCQEPSRSH